MENDKLLKGQTSPMFALAKNYEHGQRAVRDSLLGNIQRDADATRPSGAADYSISKTNSRTPR